MAAKAPLKQTPRRVDPPSAYALTDLRVLAKIVKEYDLTEVEVEQGGQRIRLRRERGFAVAPAPVQLPAPVSVAAPPPAPVAAPVAAEPAAAKDDGTTTITSPFVGTFYRAPSPESSPFVEVGQAVKPGQVLCIVEAMKLMNEIEAESSCKIVEILAKNGEPVEFGQALFKVLPVA